MTCWELPEEAPDPRGEETRAIFPSGLPKWVEVIRPHQWDAVRAIVAEYEEGVDLVWLDAPVGSGKTLIAEMVRQILAARNIAAKLPVLKSQYVCSDKSLQEQFLKDFSTDGSGNPNARVLMGRSNYTPTRMDGMGSMGEMGITCADCSGPQCNMCEGYAACPYVIAKRVAEVAPTAVLNTAYLLAAGRYAEWRRADFTVLDECDVMEGALMGFVEFFLGDGYMKKLKVAPLKKGVHKKTIVDWLRVDVIPAMDKKLKSGQGRLFDAEASVKEARERKAMESKLEEAKWIADELERDIKLHAEEEQVSSWVRDNNHGDSFVMKPVRVDRYGQRYVWRMSRRWLCMSGTIVSPDEMEDSLGVGLTCATVTVPMTFPAENRPIVVAGVARVVKAEMDDAVKKLALAIDRICERHPGERVLVHTVSYQLAGQLKFLVEAAGRKKLTYHSSSEKEWAVREYRQSEGAVLFAPSMSRGVDFKDDDCRVVVIAKVPYPYLGDPQVGNRMRGEGGRFWYTVQTVRTVMQMVGRGVRHEDDWCATYILDREFMGNLWRNGSRLFPAYVHEAIDRSFPVRELLG